MKQYIVYLVKKEFDDVLIKANSRIEAQKICREMLGFDSEWQIESVSLYDKSEWNNNEEVHGLTEEMVANIK